MEIVRRVRSILLDPRKEWTAIRAEPTTVAGLFTSYALILGGIPALSRFVGELLIRPALYVKFNPWRGAGLALVKAVFVYVSVLAAVYVFGTVMNALAPAFSSVKNHTASMKLAIYSMTPVWLAGVVYLYPSNALWATTLASALKLAAVLYGLYILYLGMATPMMGTPREQLVGYMAAGIVVLVSLVLLQMLLGWILAVSLHV